MNLRKAKVRSEVSHSFWGVIDTAIYPVVYMLVVPFLMSGLGSKGFGFWLVINATIVILQLFNLNIGISAIKKLSASLAAGKPGESAGILSSAFIISCALAIIAGLTGSLTGYLNAAFGFAGINDAPVDSTLECFIVAGLIAGLRFPDQLFHGALKAKMLMRRSATLNLINKNGLLAITVVMALSGFDITELLWANLIYSLLNLAILLRFTMKSYPGFGPTLRIDHALLREFLAFSKWPWLQSLFVVFAFQTDRYWVSWAAGLEEVSAYGLVATLINHIHMIFSAMFIWTLARFSALHARGENAYVFYRKIQRLFTVITVSLLLLFYLVSPWIFPLWLGKQTYLMMKEYLQMFIIFELLFINTILPFYFLNGIGEVRAATMATFLFCFTSYAMMLAGLFVTGSPYWMTGGMALSMFFTIPYLHHILGVTASQRPGQHFIADLLPSFAATGVVFLPYPYNLLCLIPLLVSAIKCLPEIKLLSVRDAGYHTGK